MINCFYNLALQKESFCFSPTIQQFLQLGSGQPVALALLLMEPAATELTTVTSANKPVSIFIVWLRIAIKNISPSREAQTLNVQWDERWTKKKSGPEKYKWQQKHQKRVISTGCVDQK